MRIILYYLILLALGIANSSNDSNDQDRPGNILLKAAVFVSENAESASNINDGDVIDKSMDFTSPAVKWTVFDLGDAYNIENIILWNGENIGIEPLSIYIGNVFSPCKFHKQIKKYQICHSNVLQNINKVEINCQGSNNTGRYLAVVKGDFDSNSGSESLTIMEIEAYGTLVSGYEYLTRPQLDNADVPTPSDKAFEITRSILNGVDTVTIPAYSNSILYLNKNCQRIIWDTVSLNIFGVACQTKDGKGRIAIFGKESFVTNSIKSGQMKTLTGNILKWLSPNSNEANIKLTKSIVTVSDLKKQINAGDIIDFYTWNAYSDEVLNEIIRMCLNATISIILDHSFWVQTSAAVTNSFMKILNVFNVEPSSETFITWDQPQDYTFTSDLFIANILDYQYGLENVALNNDYLLQHGLIIAQTLSQISANIIMNSDVGSTLQRIIAKYNLLIDWICPCQVSPSIDPTDRAIVNIYSQLVMSPSLANSNYKLPCIDLFPGDFETSPKKQSATLTINSKNNEVNNPIGLYLEAGTTATYNILKVQGVWTVSVGCHTDQLDDNRPAWYRYPYITVKMTLTGQSGTIYSPYGGTLWLSTPKTGDYISITLSNVVATPFFNGRDDSASNDWKSQSINPGLWSQISGNNIVFCVESYRVRDFDGDYLENLMKNYWDKLVRMDHALIGVDWKIPRQEIVVLDIMTSMGYGHSGYPIVVWDDWYPSIFNKTLIDTEGSWGMCHEIGHNLQQSTWTYVGLSEVTNNALCLFNYDKLWHITRYGNSPNSINNEHDSITQYLDNGANFDDYQSNPWLELALYSQMANYFGWGFFKQIFKYYIDNNLTPDDDAKITTWIQSSCIITGQNLLPLFDFWGIPITDDVISSVNNLPCFFPDDFLIEFSSTRRDYIKGKYSGCSATSTFFQDYDPTNDIDGTLPNFITFS